MADDAAGGSGTATAAVGVGGDILSTALGMANQQWATAGTKQMQKRSIAANAQSQLAAYNYARALRQTAYQDTMNDMRAAGLNPMLAFSQGASGAAPVSAAGAPSGTADSSARSAVNGQSINSALNAGLVRQQMHENILATREQAFRERSQGQLNEVNARLAPMIAAAGISRDLGSADSSHSAAGHYRQLEREATERTRNITGAGAGPPWLQALRQWFGGEGGVNPPHSAERQLRDQRQRERMMPPHRDPRPPGREFEFSIGPDAPRR